MPMVKTGAAAIGRLNRVEPAGNPCASRPSAAVTCHLGGSGALPEQPVYFIDLAARSRELEAAGFDIVSLHGENRWGIGENSDTSDDGVPDLVCRAAAWES